MNIVDNGNPETSDANSSSEFAACQWLIQAERVVTGLANAIKLLPFSDQTNYQIQNALLQLRAALEEAMNEVAVPRPGVKVT